MYSTWNRRQFLAGSAAAAITSQTARSQTSASSRPRGVILLIGDDHSPIAGCYGDKVIRTPNLDRLAAQGVRFTHAYCTTASCSASRSVMLSGLHNHANGQFGHSHQGFQTHAWVQSTPRLARATGAMTGVIGKLHVLPESVYPWDFQPKVGGRDVATMADHAAEFLKAAGDRPFYLHVGYEDPHRSAKGFGNERTYPRIRTTTYSPKEVPVPAWLPDQPEVRAELADYYESIDRLDQGIGMMLDALEASGRLNDTLVIYLGDNGLPFTGAKASFYESGNLLPLIIRSPHQNRRGTVNHAMTAFPDLLPTIINWLGVPPPSYPLHGRSLLPILEQENPSGWDEVFFSHTFHEVNNYYPYRGIRTRRHRYVNFLFPELELPLPTDLFASPTWQGMVKRGDDRMGVRSRSAFLRHAKEELYDLEADPHETTNLAQRPELAATLTELRAKVLAFRERTQDPWLVVDRQRGDYPGS
jgi:N-sulfoglucosamine sulfohydrolase